MQSNIDYREIVQTITSNVLSDVKAQLASMQLGIVNDIVKKTQSSLQTSLDSLASQLSDVQKRLAQLEQKAGASSSPSTPAQTPSASGTTNTSSAPPQMDTQTRIMLLKIYDSIKIFWGGWIIYLDKENKHVFMIRENGTDKKDITKYFQRYPSSFLGIIENGSDLIIKYKDTSYKSEYTTMPKP